MTFCISGSATKEYLVFIKDCVGRLCDRLYNDCHEQPVQDLRRVMSKRILGHLILLHYSESLIQLIV